jgi:xylulokinase
MSYDEMNRVASQAPIGCDGLSILPFGNGSERMLGNNDIGCSFHGLAFNRHGLSHLLRAAQEGIAFSFRYGVDIMRNLGIDLTTIRAGHSNMFLSPLFVQTLSTVCNADIELMNTDGATGAARGAGLGAQIYASPTEAFNSLKQLSVVHPETTQRAELADIYGQWLEHLDKLVSTT